MTQRVARVRLRHLSYMYKSTMIFSCVECGRRYLGVHVRSRPQVPLASAADDRNLVLPCSKVSNVLCSVMDEKTLVRKKWVMLRVIQMRPIELLVDSKIETEKRRSLSTCTTRNWRPSGRVSVRQSASVATREIASVFVRGRAKSLQTRPNISDHLLHRIPGTRQKGNVR